MTPPKFAKRIDNSGKNKLGIKFQAKFGLVKVGLWD